MSTDQLTVSRRGPGSRNSNPTDTPVATRLADKSLPPHPLSIVALAASIRLDDPRQEHERVVMLEIAIIAGREAARTLDRWLSQSLAEYRGSRSAWDLEATTEELRVEFARFDEILGKTADRLLALIPGLADGMAGLASAAESGPGRRQLLHEVAAMSGLLTAIAPRIRSATTSRDHGGSAVRSRRVERGIDEDALPAG